MNTTQTNSMSKIVDAHKAGQVSLRPNAARTHDTGEDTYDSYGWHTSSDIFGDCELQTVEYGWLDDGLKDKYVLLTPTGCPLEGTEYASREDLLAAARALWPDSVLDGDYVRDAEEDELAEIEHQSADPVERTISALGWPKYSSESDREIKSERRAIAEALVDRARSVREDMDSVEGLLDEAVAAYERGDLDAVIEALQHASSTENDHGDDPATSELIHDLLQIEEEE